MASQYKIHIVTPEKIYSFGVDTFRNGMEIVEEFIPLIISGETTCVKLILNETVNCVKCELKDGELWTLIGPE